MGAIDNRDDFSRSVRAARAWAGESHQGFARLLGYEGESTVQRWETGDHGQKLDTPSGRRALAREIIDKTGCPPALFNLDPENGALESLRVEVERVQDRQVSLLATVDRLSSEQASQHRRLARLERSSEGTGN